MKSKSTTNLRSRLCVVVASAPGAGKTLLVQSLLGMNDNPRRRYPTTVHDTHLTYSEINMHMSPMTQATNGNDRARTDPRFGDIVQQWRAHAWLQQKSAIDASVRDRVTRCSCNSDAMYTPMHTTTSRQQQQQPYEMQSNIAYSTATRSIISSINRNQAPDRTIVQTEYTGDSSATPTADFEHDVNNTLLRRALVHYDLHDTNGFLWTREKYGRFRHIDMLIVVYYATILKTIDTALTLLKSEAVANTRRVILAEMLDPTLATNIERLLRNYFPHFVDLTPSTADPTAPSFWCELSYAADQRASAAANKESIEKQKHRFFTRCEYSATSDVREIHARLQRALAVAMESLVRERNCDQYPSFLHVLLDRWQRWRRRHDRAKAETVHHR